MTWEEAWTIISTQFDGGYSLDPEQQERVFKYASQLKPKTVIVEIGVANGRTAAAFLLAIKGKNISYTGIDNYSLTHNYDDVNNRLSKLGVPYNLIMGDSHNTPWETPIDMLLIDGGHQEDGVAPDCEIWTPLVKKGGIVMFHDYDDSHTYGHAHEAVWRNADKWTGDWENVEFYNGLKIRRRP